MGKNKSTISREVRRNSDAQGVYNPCKAQDNAANRRKKSVRKPRIKKGSKLYEYICEKLLAFWSPAIISAKWNKLHPDDRVSWATIYRAVRNRIFKGITPKTHLRRRGKKCYGRRSKFNTIHPEHTIHEWSNEIKERTECGHWEGDTVRGAPGKYGLLTLVDRKSRLLLEVKINNYSANILYEAVMKALGGLSPKSITFDNGSEFVRFKDMERDLNATVYFADPHSPWQRGNNECTNDRLRFFFPKGFDFRKVSQSDVDGVVCMINSRPHLCLNLCSPKQIFCCT